MNDSNHLVANSTTINSFNYVFLHYSNGSIAINPGIYFLNGQLKIPKNWIISGSGQDSTIFIRNNSIVGHLISLSGNNTQISQITINGNYPNDCNRIDCFEIFSEQGAYNTVISNVKVINYYHGAIGTNSQVDISKSIIKGLDNNNVSYYGIWSDNKTSISTIENNDISGNYWNAIFGGHYTIANNNLIYNNARNAGGQISSGASTIQMIVHNNIITNGSTNSYGIEICNGYWDIGGNSISHNAGNGILFDIGAIGYFVVNDNTVFDNHREGILVNPNVSNFTITNNQIFDDKVLKTQTSGIGVGSGSSNNYIIAFNNLHGETWGYYDLGNGSNKIVSNNLS